MKYRCSPSVHIFGDKIEKIWGIKEWTGWQDPDEDVLFFGMESALYLTTDIYLYILRQWIG